MKTIKRQSWEELKEIHIKECSKLNEQIKIQKKILGEWVDKGKEMVEMIDNILYYIENQDR